MSTELGGRNSDPLALPVGMAAAGAAGDIGNVVVGPPAAAAARADGLRIPHMYWDTLATLPHRHRRIGPVRHLRSTLPLLACPLACLGIRRTSLVVGGAHTA